MEADLLKALLSRISTTEGDHSGFLWNFVNATKDRAQKDALQEMMRHAPNVRLDPMEQYARTIKEPTPPVPDTLTSVLKNRKRGNP